MELVHFDLELSSDSFRIIPIGDIHLGNINCNVEKLKNTLQWIRDKEDTYIIGMGDYIEAINFSDPRFNPLSISSEYLKRLDDIVIKEKEELVELFEPVRDRIICFLEGNHERKVHEKYHINIQKEICEELGVIDASTISYIRIKVRGSHKRSVIVHAYHGSNAPSEGTTALSQLIKNSRGKDADIFLCAHSHHLISTSELYISMGKNKIMKRKRYYGITGSFLETYVSGKENYIDIKGSNPRKTGVLRIDVYPKKESPDIHVRC
jgi:predicted MPP superfamily phosphohydrolase